MVGNINTTLTALEQRIGLLEQAAPLVSHPFVEVETNEDGTTAVVEELDWSVAGGVWESYSVLAALPSGDPNYPGFMMSTPYAEVSVHRVGGLCHLSGLVRRKTGSYSSGVRANVAMFALPLDWRPAGRVVLACTMGNSDPVTPPASLAIGTAWVEVRPETDPLLASGRVYFVGGTVSLASPTGWVALNGAFPLLGF